MCFTLISHEIILSFIGITISITFKKEQSNFRGNRK